MAWLALLSQWAEVNKTEKTFSQIDGQQAKVDQCSPVLSLYETESSQPTGL